MYINFNMSLTSDNPVTIVSSMDITVLMSLILDPSAASLMAPWETFAGWYCGDVNKGPTPVLDFLLVKPNKNQSVSWLNEASDKKRH